MKMFFEQDKHNLNLSFGKSSVGVFVSATAERTLYKRVSMYVCIYVNHFISDTILTTGGLHIAVVSNAM